MHMIKIEEQMVFNQRITWMVLDDTQYTNHIFNLKVLSTQDFHGYSFHVCAFKPHAPVLCVAMRFRRDPYNNPYNGDYGMLVTTHIPLINIMQSQLLLSSVSSSSSIHIK